MKKVDSLALTPTPISPDPSGGVDKRAEDPRDGGRREEWREFIVSPTI